MNRNGLITGSLTVLVCGMWLNQPTRANASDKNPDTVEAKRARGPVEEFRAFTHLAYIPAGADVSSIRFESAKTFDVPTKVQYTTDTRYCDNLAYREPGGSMYCAYSQTVSTVVGYEVTYSYRGEPLAADEYAGQSFRFHVYFRPEELSPQVRTALAEKKLSREEAAGYFSVSHSLESAPQMVIDREQSSFCDQTLMDGVLTPADPHCQDRIAYKTVSAQSGYLTLRVDTVSSR